MAISTTALPGVAPEPTTRAVVATTQPAPTDLDARLTAIDAKAGAIRDLRARFVQQRTSALLAEPITTEGEVLSAGGAVLWRSTTPHSGETRTLIRDGRLRIYSPRRKTVEEYPISGRLGELAASPLPRLSLLRELFEIAEDPAAGAGLPGSGGLPLRLTPKGDEVRRYVGHVRVRVDEARGVLTAFELTDPDGESTTLEFRDTRTNPGLSPRDLDLDVPPGTPTLRPLDPTPPESGKRP